MTPPEWTTTWPYPPSDPLNEAACEVREIALIAKSQRHRGPHGPEDRAKLGARLHAQRAGLALTIWAAGGGR